MADPQAYQISYSFAGFQANNPQTPLPAGSVDTEFQNIASAIDTIVSSVKDIRRSDGALKNKVVTLDSLSDELRSNGLDPIAAWETLTVYGVGRVLLHDGALYQVVTAHTSGTFATDLASGKLSLLAVLPTGPQGDAATVAVGSVTTGNAGTNAAVVNAGTSGAAVLNFTIPRGDQGIQGNTGPASWAAPVAWQTAQAYTATAPASTVIQGGETYLCLSSHTSGVFATDLAANKWAKVAAKGSDGAGTGDVVGPASSVALRFARFANTSGKLLEDSGVSLSTDGTLASNSDALLPSQKAVKTYCDALIAANDAMVFKGVIDCSANPNYPAADRGATYRVSVAGKIGGGSGPNVEAGDILICMTDGTASGNHATVGAQWGIIQVNIDGALTSAAIGSTVQAYDANTAKTNAVQSWSAKQSFNATLKLQQALEKVTISGSAPSSTQNFDCLTQGVQYFTSNNANNWTLNLRGDGSNSLDSLMATGEAITVAVIATNGGTAYRMTALQVDGGAVTPQWLGAAAPAGGTVNKRDTYTVTVIKTGSATFIAHASFASGN